MPNYQQGKIYTIRSYQTDAIYIGSTTQGLARRLGGHRKKYKYYKEGKYHYLTSFDILEFNDHYVELLESYECNSKEELLKREGYWIRNTQNCVNRVIPGQTGKEYYEANKEAIKETHKAYREANREKISENKIAYYANNREKIKEYKKQYYIKKKKAAANMIEED